MSRPFAFRRLLAELKRRKVFRVAAAYGAGAYVAIEVADLVLPRVGLGETAVTLVVWIAIVGLPVALGLAWVFELTPEGLRRSAPARDGELDRIATSSWRQRWPSGILALAGVALLLVGAWFVLNVRASRDPSPAGGAGAGPGGSTVVAVLPFSVSGADEYAYLRSGMVDLLSTRLDGIGPVRTVPARAVMGVVRQGGLDVTDVATAARIASTLDAGLFVTGRVVESGGRLSVAAALYRTPSGEPAAETAVEGGAEELFDMVDRLTSRLVAGLEDTPAARVSQIAALTTNSLPALEAYLEGEELFRQGRFTTALEAFERATALDSTFALAHYRVSLARVWGGHPGQLEAAEVAARHAERLSERDRLLVEATLAWRRGDGRRAEDLYRTILGRWPDDVEAWLELAEVLNHYGPMRGGSVSDSRQAFETVLRYEREHLPALWHLSRIEILEGHLTRADSMIDRLRAMSPEGDRTLELLAMRAAGRRPDEWARVLDSLRTAQDMTRWLSAWNVAVFAEDPDAAREVVATITDPSRSTEVRVTGHLLDAFLALARGRPSEAGPGLSRVAELDPGLALSHEAALAILPFMETAPETLERHYETVRAWQPVEGCTSNHPTRFFEPGTCMRPLVRLYLLGVIEARRGRTGAAEQRLAALEAEHARDVDPDHAPELAAGVRAEIALARGDTVAALAALEMPPGRIDYVDAFGSFFYSHAQERFRRAQALEALGRHDEALRWYGSFDEMSPFDLVLQGNAQLRAGRLLEELGREEEALDRYRASYAILEGGEGNYARWAREARVGVERLEASR